MPHYECLFNDPGSVFAKIRLAYCLLQLSRDDGANYESQVDRIRHQMLSCSGVL